MNNLTVFELLQQINEKIAAGKIQLNTRIMFWDKETDGPCNLAGLEVLPILDADDDYANIHLPIHDSSDRAQTWIEGMAIECETTIEALKERTTDCLILVPRKGWYAATSAR